MMTLPYIPPEMEEELRDTRILVLVTGTLTDGRSQYAYASIPIGNYLEFKAAEAQGAYRLDAYGDILAHGEGKTPPAEVQQRMEQDHGANHLFEEQLEAMLAQMQSSSSS